MTIAGAGIERPRKRRSRLWLIAVGAVLAAIVAGGCFFVHWYRVYRNYPKRPDIAAASLDEVWAFIASDEFNRMTEKDRRTYAISAMDRTADRPVPDLIAMMMNRRDMAQRKKAAENIAKLPDNEQISERLFGRFLERFYQQDKGTRLLQINAMLLAPGRDERQRDRERKSGDIDKFKADMAKFMTHQTPHTQGMFGQFMMDVRRAEEVQDSFKFWKKR